MEALLLGGLVEGVVFTPGLRPLSPGLSLRPGEGEAFLAGLLRGSLERGRGAPEEGGRLGDFCNGTGVDGLGGGSPPTAGLT